MQVCVGGIGASEPSRYLTVGIRWHVHPYVRIGSLLSDLQSPTMMKLGAGGDYKVGSESDCTTLLSAVIGELHGACMPMLLHFRARILQRKLRLRG